MRQDAIALEERRLASVAHLDDYQKVHERHRIFPAVFEDRRHRRVIDLSAGVGVLAARIKAGYPCELVCNDISPAALRLLRENGLLTSSFDLDAPDGLFPFPNEHFDAVVCLATIEHIIHTEHFLSEVNRIMSRDGYLYLSAPNYAGLLYLIPFLRTGRSFHDPLSPDDRYEFFAHVRYFTYRTLVELVNSFGFVLDTTYLPLPAGSTKYIRLKDRSRLKAFMFRSGMHCLYRMGSPRWCSEPVLCFAKSRRRAKPRKVIL